MKDYFCPQMDVGDINSISMLGLAHIGDGVYELLTRTMLCAGGNKKVTELHKKDRRHRKCSGSGRGCREASAAFDGRRKIYL